MNTEAVAQHRAKVEETAMKLSDTRDRLSKIGRDVYEHRNWLNGWKNVTDIESRRLTGEHARRTLFIVLSNLFAVYAPQVVREAIDLISAGFARLQLPEAESAIAVPATLPRWVSWTGIGIEERVLRLGDGGELQGTLVWLAGMLALLYLALALLKGFFLFLMRQTIIVVSRLIEYDLKNDVFAHYQPPGPRLLQAQQHRRPHEPHQLGRGQGAHVPGPRRDVHHQPWGSS